MFYAHIEDRDIVNTQFSGNGFTCYRGIRMSGGKPKFLMDMPQFNEEGKLVSTFPVLDGDYHRLLEMRWVGLSVLTIIPTWLIAPEFPRGGPKNWTCKRVESIWECQWMWGNTELSCSRIRCIDGSEIDVLGSTPRANEEVDWVQIL